MRAGVVWFGIAVVIGCSAAWAQTPTLSNVAFTQGPIASPPGTQVLITYSLVSSGGNCTVTAMLSKDGGATFPYPITSVSGDIGTGVAPGTNKQIIWSISQDYPNENIANACIKLTAILGSSVECVNNGTFTGSLTHWTSEVSGDWTYNTTTDSTGAAAKLSNTNKSTLTQPVAEQANAVVVGTAYTVTYTIASYLGGNFRMYLGTANGALHAAAGTFTETITCAGNASIIIAPSNNGSRGIIDNVSVRTGGTFNTANSPTGVLNTIQPTVTVEQATGQVDPADTAPINFTATFSKSVTGFAASDVAISGTAGGTKTATLSGGSQIYTIAIAGMSSGGTVIAAVPSGTCWDALGNGNIASTSTDNSVTYVGDTQAPTGSVSINGGDAYTNNVSVTLTLSASDNVGVTDMRFNNDGGGWSAWETYNASKTWTLAATAGTRTVNVQYRDSAGNVSSTYSDSIILDTTAPTCTVSTTSSSPTMAQPIPFTITFSESVTGFTQSNVNVTNGSIASFSGSGATYGLTVTPSGNSTTVSVSVSAGAAQDQAGNNNTAATPVSVIYDNVAPTCTVTGPASPTNVSPISFTITFSDPVTGLTADEIDVAGGVKGALAGSGATYTLPVTPSGQGTVSCHVPAGVAQKSGGVDNQGSNTCAVTYDSETPSCTVSGPVSPTNGTPITFTIHFSETVSGFTTAGISVTNGSMGTLTGTGAGPYTIDVTPLGQGVVTCQVQAGATQDAAGNGNSASNSLNVTYDSLAPTCVVSSAGSTTNLSPIVVTLTFSEPVQGLDASKVTVTGGTADAPVGTGSGPAYSVYTVNLTPAAQGAVTCQVQAGAAQDAASNDNMESNSLSVVYDTTPPTCSVTSPISGVSNTSPIPFTLTFDEPVSGLVASALVLSNGTASTLLTSDNKIFSVDVTPLGQGAVKCQVPAGAAHDAAGNSNEASNNASVIYDDVAPSCVVTGPTSPTNANPVVFTLTFSEAITGLTAGSVSVTNGSVQLLSGGPTVYSVQVAGMTDGAVACEVAAAVAQDQAGNDNDASNNASVWYDGTRPSCMITGPSSPTETEPIVLTVAFSEEVSGLSAQDFAVNNGAIDTLDSTDQQTYTLSIVPAGTGTVTCQLAADAAQDAAKNGNDASNMYSVLYNTAHPSCTVSASASAFSANPIVFTITFDVPVTGLIESAINVTGGSAVALSGSGADYTLEVNALAEGTVTCSVPAGAAQAESSGGLNNASNTLSVSYDTTAPTVTIAQAATQADPTNASPINFTVTFNEHVLGFDETDIALGGTANPTVALVTPTDPNTYNVAVSGMTASGTVIVNVGAGQCADAAGNGNAAATTADNVVTYDTTSPSCAVSGPPSPTQSASITFTLTFDKPVSNLDAAFVAVTGGAVDEPIGVGSGPYYSVYTVDVTPAGQGTVTCQVLPNAAQDAAGNGNMASNTSNVIYDSVEPTCVVSVPASVTGTVPIVFTLTFSEPVSGLLAGAVELTNGFPGTLTTLDNQEYALEVTPAGEGTVTCQVPAAAAQDAAGNANTASNVASTISDTILPDCSVTGPTSPSNANPLLFILTFSEPVTGLQVAEVALTNGTPGAMTSADSVQYVLEVHPLDQGDVTCQVLQGTAHDAAGNGNAASNVLTVTYDSMAPVCTVIAPSGPIHTPPISFTISFSEAVTDLTLDSITIENGMTGSFTGSEAGPYTLMVTPLRMGDVTCSVAAGAVFDAAGNASEAPEMASVYYDNPNPACWVTAPASPTNHEPLVFDIAFGEAVTGLDMDEIVVTNGSKVSLTGSLMSYSLTVTPNGQGTVTCLVPADAARNATDYGNTESNLAEVIYDTVSPTVRLTLDALSPTTDNLLTFNVTFSEDVGSTFSFDRILFEGSLAADAYVSNVEQYGRNYLVTATVPDTNADGTLGIGVMSGVTDLAGNECAGGDSPQYTVRNWFGFSAQPQDARKYVGDTISFGVVLNDHGSSTPNYQWWYASPAKAASTPLAGQTGTLLTLGPLIETQAGQYWCAVNYMNEEELSNTAQLEVKEHVQITVQPQDAQIASGGHHAFSVVATGGYPPLAFHWKKDGSTIPSAPNASTLTLSNAATTDTGVYTVEVDDSNGDSTLSEPAELIVQGSALPVEGSWSLLLLTGVVLWRAIRARSRKE